MSKQQHFVSLVLRSKVLVITRLLSVKLLHSFRTVLGRILSVESCWLARRLSVRVTIHPGPNSFSTAATAFS